jgi:uncharacterized membrane protein
MSYQPQQPYKPKPQLPPPAGRARIDVVGDACRLLGEQFGTWASASLRMIALSLLAMAPLIAVAIAQSRNGGAVNHSVDFLITMLYAAVMLPLRAGMEYMALKQIRGNKINSRDLFQGFRRWQTILPAAILLQLPGTLISFLGLGISTAFLLPSVILQTFLSLTYLIILDQRVDPIAAMKLSFQKVKSNFFVMLGILLLSGLLASLGMLGCGIGMILTFPLVPLCTALAYRDLFPERFTEESEESAREDLDE